MSALTSWSEGAWQVYLSPLRSTAALITPRKETLGVPSPVASVADSDAGGSSSRGSKRHVTLLPCACARKFSPVAHKSI
jgi:hypothetical protein